MNIKVIDITKVAIKRRLSMKKIKQVLSLTCLFSLLTLILSPIVIAQTDTVTATVTAQNVSVSVADGAVAYGTVSTSSTEDTTTNGVDDSQTATNDGNVTEDLTIRGWDTTNWTLGGTAASETYTHKFCTSTCDSSPSWTALTTSYQTLADDVSSSGTQVFDLQIGTPTSTSNYTEQSADVTVMAAAS